MQRRRWVATTGIACALLCAFAGAWIAIAFLRAAPDDGRGAVGAATKSVTARNDMARETATRDDDASKNEASQRELTPTVVPVEPRLEWPDVATLRRIEQRGRALFGGVVYAPDGSPCPGASVWCGEKVVATTDDHGAWRADVARPFDDENEGSPRFVNGIAIYNSNRLAARKEGVGHAETEIGSGSCRVDLHLQRGFNFGGTVVDNDTLNPVAGAELDAHVAWIHEQTKADALAHFAFQNLPSGNLDLAGRATGYDSNGTFPYNFDRGRDVEITFRLTKAYRLRGQFVPWPAPAIAATEAQVCLVPSSPHDKGSSSNIRGAVGADGAFDLPLPVCPSCRVEFAVAGSTLWQTDVDVNEEKHDVDLGRIELAAAPATLTGRVEIADEKLRSRVEVAVSVSFESGRPAVIRKRLAADGTFRVTPLAAGYASLVVYFDGSWLAATEQASGLTSAERDFGAGFVLAAGEARDVGVIVPITPFFWGTVRDGRGEPIASARINAEIRFPSGAPRPHFGVMEMAWTDEDGRFSCDYIGGAKGMVSQFVKIHARGFAPQRFEVERPEGAIWIHRDFVLDDRCLLRGTLVDETGAPLAGWSIRVEPADVPDDDPDDRAATDLTQSDGSFEIRGLEAGEFTLYAHPRSGATVKFTKVHPEKGELTLRTSDAMAASTSK